MALLLSLNSFSQQIYIGQSAAEVEMIVSQRFKTYEQVLEGRGRMTMEYEPQYNNGELDDIILCTGNAFMTDLNREVNYCTHYVINKDKLNYVAVQYFNISIQALESIMDKSMLKIGDYYFGDSSEYVYFKLMKTGEVVKTYRSLSLNPPPPNILKQLHNISQNSLISDSQKILNSKYISAKQIILNVDGEPGRDANGNLIKGNLLLWVEINSTKDSTNNHITSVLSIKYQKSNKIYKKAEIEYDKSEKDKYGMIDYYKILNTVNEDDDNTLLIRHWPSPRVINGKTYRYTLTLLTILQDGSDEGRTELLCNILK